MAGTSRTLIIDDDRGIRSTLAFCLESLGGEVAQAASGEIALAALRARTFDFAFLDLRLGSDSGLDLLPKLLAERPDLDVVVITAYATFDTAVEAIRLGARDYLPKPFTPAQIRHVVEKLQERRRLQWEVDDLRAKVSESAPDAMFVTRSPKMQATMDLIARAAAFDTPVLLRGESGTGKGVLARALHSRSPRRDRPFVVVNCPTLTGELLASELFGHVKGAFTGATKDKPGRVEAAESGTLFLDEIAELPTSLQAKLLVFLQERTFERVGENRSRQANVRIVAATNRDLESAIATGTLREDLFYRLNALEVLVPPLRERVEDIPLLATEFVAFFARAAQRPPPQLTPEAVGALTSYPWPGNVRELRNAIERALILAPGQTLGPEVFPARIIARPAIPELGGLFTVDEIEREHIRRIVARSATLEDASRILGLDASTLWRKRKKYGD